MTDYLSDSEFETAFNSFERDAFNINLLPDYNVEADQDSLNRWRRGEPISEAETNSPWQQTLRRYRSDGKSVRRLKVISGELTEQQRNGLEWWWPNNDAAGEETRVLDTSRTRVDLPPHDFWLLDHAKVLIMDYDNDAKWLGARIHQGDIAPYVRWAQTLWDASISWRDIAQMKA